MLGEERREEKRGKGLGDLYVHYPVRVSLSLLAFEEVSCTFRCPVVKGGEAIGG
jgi:hypothetical protein